MKKKKPSFLTYDLIRQNKFRSPEKIKTVEELLEKNDYIINWWCRQSGKSLTSLKIARDKMIKSKIDVIFVAHNTAAAGELKTKMARCIDRDLVSNESANTISLKNGSIALFSTPGSIKELKGVSLVCIDEFEFFTSDSMASLMVAINNVISPSIWTRFKEMFSMKKTANLQLIFASSMKNKSNLNMIKAAIPGITITLMNYEKINYGPGRIEELKKIMSEKAFNTEYNSYF